MINYYFSLFPLSYKVLFWRSDLLVNNLYLNAFLIMIISYFIGSVPTAYIAGKIKGVDITIKGNKNVGATNAIFLLGKTIGIVVLLIDKPLHDLLH